MRDHVAGRGVETANDMRGRVADTYAGECNWFLSLPLPRRFFQHMGRVAGTADAGCGSGIPVAGSLANNGHGMIGVDSSETVIRITGSM